MSLYLLFLLLLCSSAFFSSSETAYFNLSKHRRHQLANDSRRSARRVASLRAQPRSLLVTVLFGNELTNIALSIVSASILSDHFPSLTLAEQAMLSASIVVPTLLIFGEITPKSIAAVISDKVAIAYAYPLSFFSWLITPARWALLRIADVFTQTFSNVEEGGEESLNEEGFRALVEAGTREGILDQEESALIHNAFHFNDREVSEVMIPWSKVFTVGAETAISEAIDEITQHAFSRIPIWSEEEQRVRGVLYAKDLLIYKWGDRSTPSSNPLPLRHSVPIITHPENQFEAAKVKKTVCSLAHTVVFTEANRPLGHLLETFKRRRKHMAIVVSPEGGEPLGICTLEDALEVIFGPIHEESLSDGELHADELLRKIGESYD